MTAPTKIVWPLEAHTRAKHEILRRYLEAWTAILGLGGFRTIVYVDGFAGPGIYDNGEDGSPMIALKAALKPQARTLDGRVDRSPATRAASQCWPSWSAKASSRP